MLGLLKVLDLFFECYVRGCGRKVVAGCSSKLLGDGRLRPLPHPHLSIAYLCIVKRPSRSVVPVRPKTNSSGIFGTLLKCNKLM